MLIQAVVLIKMGMMMLSSVEELYDHVKHVRNVQSSVIYLPLGIPFAILIQL